MDMWSEWSDEGNNLSWRGIDRRCSVAEDELRQAEERWALLGPNQRLSSDARRLRHHLQSARLGARRHALRLLTARLGQLGQDVGALTREQELRQGGRGKEMETEETGLLLLSGYAATYRHYLAQWPRLQGSLTQILANAPSPGSLPTRHRQEALRLGQLGRHCLSLLLTSLHLGLQLYAQLSIKRLSVAFLADLVECVNNLCMSQKELHRLFEPYGLRPTPAETTLDLKTFFGIVAEADAAQLAEKVASHLADHIEPCGDQEKKGKSAEQTSDYCSSSSSMRTEETLLERGRPKGRTGPSSAHLQHLEKELGQVYTRFLEERYSVFVAMLEQAGTHSDLCARETGGTARPRSVSFLDTALRRRRRTLWRAYVGRAWDGLQEQLLRRWTVGASKLPPLLVPNLSCTAATSSSSSSSSSTLFVASPSRLLHAALNSVPLPEHLARPTRGIQLWEAAMSGQQRGIALMSIGGGELSGDGTRADNSGSEGAKHWLLATAGAQAAAQLNFSRFCRLRYASLPASFSVKSQLSGLDAMLQEKIQSITRAFLAHILKSQKNKTLNKEMISSTAEFTMAEVVGPLRECNATVSDSERQALLELSLQAVFSAFLNYIHVNSYRIGESGLSGLEEWEESLRQSLVSSDSLVLSYVSAGTDSLRERLSRRPASASLRLRRVAPSSQSSNSNPIPPSLPPLSLWPALAKKRNPLLPSCCFS